jgi:DNA-binding response OmpR family regulator
MTREAGGVLASPLDTMRPECRLRFSGAQAAAGMRVEGGRVGAPLLLVEDDHSIGGLVRDYLAGEGHAVVWVRSGEEALAEYPRHPVRLVVLDIGLPGIDGLEVCRRLRTRADVPVLMLTARDEEVDRLCGFAVGGDDYVTKPFSMRELAARVKAILRRTDPHAPEEMLVLGDVLVGRKAREVSVDGSPVDLTPREFDLLAHLMANPGVVLHRDRLLEQVWGLEFPGGTRTVDQHVAQLRAKLGRPELIATVHGVGYKAVRR